eukprot:2801697-Rhodomonas_salina.2
MRDPDVCNEPRVHLRRAAEMNSRTRRGVGSGPLAHEGSLGEEIAPSAKSPDSAAQAHCDDPGVTHDSRPTGRPETLDPGPWTLDPRPSTLDPRPSTLDPRP